MQMSYLSHLTTFRKNFTNVHRLEVVHESSRGVLLHMPLQARTKELFTIEEHCATEFEIGGNDIKFIHTCCGKVSVSKGDNNNNNKKLGCILEETTNHKWKILLEDHNAVHSNKFTCVRNKRDVSFLKAPIIPM